MSAHNIKSWRTPVYTFRDVAELFAEHRREHPDHGNDCPCRNGLITALRKHFGSIDPVVSRVVPYVPPDVARAGKRREVVERKPWLKQCVGETDAAYHHRISHSCFSCGSYILDHAILDRHEDGCSLQGRRRTGGGGA